jgi:putative Mn2+ efflux pump MntP
MGKLKFRTLMLITCIVVSILKMVIGINFSMSGINSEHHYLPTYQILMISDNVEFLPPIFYYMFLVGPKVLW